MEPSRSTRAPYGQDAPARPAPGRLGRDRTARYGGDERTGVEQAREPREPRDHERVGFGADAPAFLLRATPLPPPAKAEKGLEVDA